MNSVTLLHVCVYYISIHTHLKNIKILCGGLGCYQDGIKHKDFIRGNSPQGKEIGRGWGSLGEPWHPSTSLTCIEGFREIGWQHPSMQGRHWGVLGPKVHKGGLSPRNGPALVPPLCSAPCTDGVLLRSHPAGKNYLTLGNLSRKEV